MEDDKENKNLTGGSGTDTGNDCVFTKERTKTRVPVSTKYNNWYDDDKLKNKSRVSRTSSLRRTYIHSSSKGPFEYHQERGRSHFIKNNSDTGGS